MFDQPLNTACVAHGDHVTVVDGHDGTMIGQVEGFASGTHGIAIDRCWAGATPTMGAPENSSFDLKTLKTGKHIKAAEDADAIAFDPASGHVFVVNSEPGTLTVIDPKTDSAVATVKTGGKLEYAVARRTQDCMSTARRKEIVRWWA